MSHVASWIKSLKEGFSLQEKRELCGIRTDAWRLAALATYV